MKKVLIAISVAAIAIAYYIFANASDDMTYVTEKAKIADIENTIGAVGQISAIRLVNVGAQVSGQIETINVKMGDKVKKGDLIAKIDSTEQQNEMKVIAAKLESYNAQLRSSQIALATAESKYNRTKTLLETSAASKQAYEEAQNEYEAAKSRVVENISLIKQNEISLENAKKNLAYSTIIAPIDGVIVSLPVKAGQTLNASFDTPSIAQVADLSSVEILIEISEGDILKIKEGQKARFSILSEDTVYETFIKSIDPAFTLLTNDKYNGVIESDQAIYYYARIEYPNEEGKFRIGMTTQSDIQIEGAKNVLTIPTSAVSEKNGRKFVNVIEDKRSLEKEIITGVSDNAYIEVKSGLLEGEEVIVSQMSLKELQKKEEEIPEDLDVL
ncbi:MAG: efflux RND transporter periplasmic adaptor subunit [Helicobacteraceae bacterium]|jgi:macrolide-specific efflux system membrane fusion protein|nr:efflux RND transporter periplasmic adaptor subunit [Helicobacteraceae bacterium]